MSETQQQQNNCTLIYSLPVKFGNPALGTYDGFVHTYQNHEEEEEDDDDENPHESDEIHPTLSSYSKYLKSYNIPQDFQRPSNNNENDECSESIITTATLMTLEKERRQCEKMVAMINVPPERMFADLIHFIGSHVTHIKRVRVLISDQNNDMSGEKKEKESSNQNQNKKNYVVLYEMNDAESAREIILDLHGKPYMFLQEDDCCEVYHILPPLHNKQGVSIIDPFFSATEADTSDKSSSSIPLPPPMSPSAAAAIKNSPSLSVISDSNELPNCPVCLEPIRHTLVITTLCNHTFHLECLLQCQDSPCPVCRYDHSGLNETLSTCHLCGTTENVYICLICGVVSCSNTQIIAKSENEDEDDDIILIESHAQEHYSETLHAYALETSTQNVFDFAGNGYVHRLIQSENDGKLVEVNNPLYNGMSNERPSNPPPQEEEVVHRKLENYASEYYTLLKEEMDKQRNWYEKRLQDIRSQYPKKRKTKKTTAIDLINALKQEAHNLEQRSLSIQQKNEKLTSDIEFLKQMNYSIKEVNVPALRKQILLVQKEKIAAKEMMLKCLPPLEEKMKKLMSRLETGGTISAESSSSVKAAVQDESDDRKPAAR